MNEIPRPPEELEAHGWGRGEEEQAPQSGPAPRGPRGISAVGRRFVKVWYRDGYVYLKMWKTNIFPPLIEPFLFLFAMGLGVGHYVESIEGVEYLAFVAPGVVATTAVLRATFECTFGSYFRMHFQNTFDAIISTPVSPEELSLGEIFWGASRSFINVVVVSIALTFMGIIPVFLLPLVLVLQFVGGINFGAMALIVTSKVKQTEYFNFYLMLVIFPAELLTGAFFPVSRLPDVLEGVVWLIPLTSLIDVTRTIVLDGLLALDWISAAQVGYLLLSTILLVEIALRRMRRRLIA